MTTARYSVSFTTGGLFMLESTQIADGYLRSGDWQSAISEAAHNYAFSSSKSKSMQRVGREIANRLSTLDRPELEFLVEASARSDKAALLWLAICRTYRLVREFAIEIVSEQYSAYQRDLPKERYDSFFHDKGEWDPWLAARSKSTVERSRQVLFKMMKEAGVLDEENRINRLTMSPSLKRLLAGAPADHAVFPGWARG